MNFKIKRLVLLNENYRSVNQVLKAYNVFGVMTIPLIKKNPYILWENIERIHFFYVDKLALQLGFNYNSPERVDAAIIYCLNFDIQKGNTCYSYSDLITAVVNLIKVNYILQAYFWLLQQ